MQTHCSFKSAIEKSTKTMTEAKEKDHTDPIDLYSRTPLGQLMQRAVTYKHQAGADGSNAPLPSRKKFSLYLDPPSYIGSQYAGCTDFPVKVVACNNFVYLGSQCAGCTHLPVNEVTCKIFKCLQPQRAGRCCYRVPYQPKLEDERHLRTLHLLPHC